jgi:Peroxidase
MSAVLLNALLDRPNSPVTNLRALALRLSFHDCVGGCNGCINFNNPDNAGLQPAVTSLTSLYYANGYNNIVSLADFYALAATVSITNAVQESNYQRSGTFTSPCPVPCFSMQWGRIDSLNCSNDASVLPNPAMTGDAMFAYFANEFGFTKNQVVALMGAHSFGTALPANSGYNGKWTGQQNKGLSEVFYSMMIDPTVSYTNTDVGNGTGPRWEFRTDFQQHSIDGFMFNTDFEIFYNLRVNSVGQVSML